MTQNSRFGKLSELPAINKRFQNVLLYVVIAVNNACHLLAKLRKIFNGLSNAIVSDIVGGRFGAQVEVVTHVLLDESVAVMAADDRVGQFEIFDHRLEFAPI